MCKLNKTPLRYYEARRWYTFTTKAKLTRKTFVEHKLNDVIQKNWSCDESAQLLHQDENARRHITFGELVIFLGVDTGYL